MIIVHHRRNSAPDLAGTDRRYGVEIDLRNHGRDIIVTHDAFVTDAITLDEWLEGYRHSFLIANVKEEGLEPRLQPLLEQHGVRNYFILDESFPFIRRYAHEGLSKFALRVSEFESSDTAIRLAEDLKIHDRAVDWIWADSFTGMPINPFDAEKLRAAGYKICAVSPELHHVGDPQSWERRIRRFLTELQQPGMGASRPDMICTKRPDLWEQDEIFKS